MKKGTLCRVTRLKTHRPCQYNDLVVILERTGISNTILVAQNLKTLKTYHFWEDQLEVISEGR